MVGLSAILWLTGRPRQQITLSDGTVVTLKGVTFGTNHVQGSTIARLIHILPETVSDRLVELNPRTFDVEKFETTSDALFVWCRVDASKSQNPRRGVDVMLAPAMAPPGVELGSIGVLPPDPISLAREYFDVLPRRAREVDLVLFDSDTSPSPREVGRFRFKNPAHSEMPPWEPESLPAIQRDGDLEVRLLEFVSGISDIEDFGERGDEQYFSRYKVGMPAVEPAVVVAWEARTVDRPSEQWAVERAALSDPTGNKIVGRIFYRTKRTLSIASALWPDEPAWKLTLDLKRESGHHSNDLVVFTNAPIPEVGGTSTLNWTNSANGLAVELEWFKNKPAITDGPWRDRGYSWVRLTHEPLPPELVLDFVSVTADEGTTLRAVTDSHFDESYHVAFKELPPGARYLNLTFAVQKLRRVEFFVAPNWLQGTNSFEYVEPASKR